MTPTATPAAATPYQISESLLPFAATAAALGSGHPSPAKAARCMATAAARQFAGSEMGPSGYPT